MLTMHPTNVSSKLMAPVWPTQFGKIRASFNFSRDILSVKFHTHLDLKVDFI